MSATSSKYVPPAVERRGVTPEQRAEGYTRYDLLVAENLRWEWDKDTAEPGPDGVTKMKRCYREGNLGQIERDVLNIGDSYTTRSQPNQPQYICVVNDMFIANIPNANLTSRRNTTVTFYFYIADIPKINKNDEIIRTLKKQLYVKCLPEHKALFTSDDTKDNDLLVLLWQVDVYTAEEYLSRRQAEKDTGHPIERLLNGERVPCYFKVGHYLHENGIARIEL